MLAKGCVGYLANVVDTIKKTKLKPVEEPIVRVFMDVFSENLPRLPSN